MSELTEHLEMDAHKLKNAIKLQVPVEITSYTLPRNMELYMHEVLERFLDECHQEQLKEYLNFCLGEIITNGKKANTKRIYFKEQGLDINNREDYKKGMETFKIDTMGNLEYYLELQKKEGLYVKLSLKLDIDNVVVEIKNNSVLTVFEQERIQNKLDSVQQYHNMEEVFSKVLDTSEGAGLGIIIMILMLQKVGLSKDNFKIYSNDRETITRIVLPCNNEVYADLYELSQNFVAKQSSIPVYQSTLEEIEDVLKSEKIDRNAVLGCIRRNASLAYAAVQKSQEKNNFSLSLYSIVESLSNAELQVLYSKQNNIFRIVEPTAQLDDLFSHSQKVAVNCYNLAKNSQLLGYELCENEEYLFTLGLLSSFGLVMIETRTEEQNAIINAVKSQSAKDIFMSGFNSGFLNLQYAKNSGFPDIAAYELAGWNCRRLCPAQVGSVMNVLYLAEVMQYYSEGKLEFYQIDRDMLSLFKIGDETQLNFIINQIKSVY